jgi:hypothetical protein
MAPGPTRLLAVLAVFAALANAAAQVENSQVSCKPAQIRFGVPKPGLSTTNRLCSNKASSSRPNRRTHR